MEQSSQDDAGSNMSSLVEEAHRLSRERTSSVRDIASSFEARLSRTESVNPLDLKTFTDKSDVKENEDDSNNIFSEPGPISVGIPITQMAGKLCLGLHKSRCEPVLLSAIRSINP